MNIAKIAYLGELFNMLQMQLRDVSSGELNALGLTRRYRNLSRVLRQISSVSAGIAATLDAESERLKSVPREGVL